MPPWPSPSRKTVLWPFHSRPVRRSILAINREVPLLEGERNLSSLSGLSKHPLFTSGVINCLPGKSISATIRGAMNPANPRSPMDTITDQLIIDKKDGVGRITFDNQARRNALTYEMWQGIPIVMADFAEDDGVRVIVLSGAGGKAFSAGADISEFAKKRSGEEAVAVYNEAVSKATDALIDARKPLLAKIDGF
ncbi:MAG TPA: hypothetical protein EYO85_03105, partial [Rhodospirillales bacterium]|nr:hypothetical protein [Rhodospirillales bacterium]